MRNAISTKTYWFIDEETGEEFFTEATNVYLAKTIAKKYFSEPKMIGRVTRREAEEMGYDTYQKGKTMIKREIINITDNQKESIKEVYKILHKVKCNMILTNTKEVTCIPFDKEIFTLSEQQITDVQKILSSWINIVQLRTEK